MSERSFTLHQGDSRKVLQTLGESSVDSIVCDPPYHLTNKGGGPHNKTPNAYSRAQAGATSTGFMGMTWDGGDVAMRPEVWAECLRVLKPGGYLLAFSGTRTYHRMACAIEDAGFEIRDQIGWAYGSGFPKSHNGEWGGTALKPAWEPICMARKPLIGTVEANWLAFGTGALNIDGCRIGTTGGSTEPSGMDRYNAKLAEQGYRPNNYEQGTPEAPAPAGRWPANIIHDGSDEVVALFPSEAGAAAPVTVRNGDKFRSTYGAFAGNIDEAGSTFHGDSGSAARFFYEAKASVEDREEGLSAFTMQALAYGNQAQAEVKRGNTAHAGNSGMNTVKMRANVHPTVKPTALMAYLCRLVTPKGGTVLDPFMGSGSTGKAAMLEGFHFIGVDLSAEYVAIARARIDFARRQGFQDALL